MDFSYREERASYPLVAALGLRSRDKSLMKYYLGSALREVDFHAPNSLSLLLEQQKEGICYFPSADFESLKEIAQWNIPTLLVARLGPELERDELYSFLLKAGFCALWILPDYGKAVIFPYLPALQKKQSVLLIEENPERRRFFRQLYAFAGFDTRADCSSPQEILLHLENSGAPALLHLNLDHSGMNVVELIYSIDSFLKENPQQRKALRMLFIKDFNISGFSFANLEELLNSYARRIFSPEEALFSLLEAFFSKGSTLLPAAKLSVLDHFLYEYQGEEEEGLARLGPLEMTCPEALAFLWLYEKMAKKMGEGLLLSSVENRGRIKAGSGIFI